MTNQFMGFGGQYIASNGVPRATPIRADDEGRLIPRGNSEEYFGEDIGLDPQENYSFTCDANGAFLSVLLYLSEGVEYRVRFKPLTNSYNDMGINQDFTVSGEQFKALTVPTFSGRYRIEILNLSTEAIEFRRVYVTSLQNSVQQFNTDENDNLAIQGNTSRVLPADINIGAGGIHEFDVEVVGGSTSLSIYFGVDTNFEVRVTPRGIDGNDMDTHDTSTFTEVPNGIIEFNNKTRFYRIRVENTGNESISILQMNLTSFVSKLGGTSNIEIPDLDLENKSQYITNQRLSFLSNDDQEYPELIDESRPCMIQSIILKSDNKINRYRFTLKSLDVENSASRHVTTTPSFENIEEIGGEDAHFKLTKYDETENIYVMILKSPIYCPVGYTFELPYAEGNFKAEISTIFFNEVD